MAKSKIENYSVLLIMTDGVIHDFFPTINFIIEASYLPISIIIIDIRYKNVN